LLVYLDIEADVLELFGIVFGDIGDIGFDDIIFLGGFRTIVFEFG
jgi:hypothetical protein